MGVAVGFERGAGADGRGATARGSMRSRFVRSCAILHCLFFVEPGWFSGGAKHEDCA
jgi:hypothetical protein